MQEITRKIKDEALKDFTPIIEQMASEGMDSQSIASAFKHHIDSKIKYFYRRPDFIKLRDLTDKILSTPDSKAESILIRLLYDNKIAFVFHKLIGPYEADYVINDTLIIELDGPAHDEKRDEKRDKYLRRMGYKIIRLPIWILSINTDAIIEEIKEAAKLIKPKRK